MKSLFYFAHYIYKFVNDYLCMKETA